MVIPPEITLERATINDNSLLSNLLELYLHDLSEIFPIRVGVDGRFGYDNLPLYWSEPDGRFAYLIRSNADVAGFALVTRGSPATADPQDLDVSEFFILRSYRRGGIGRRAAFILWDCLPGRWVVRVSEMNHGGLQFWEGAIREYTRDTYRESRYPGKSHLFRAFVFTSEREAMSPVPVPRSL
jgi:predicted acetyltransferase